MSDRGAILAECMTRVFVIIETPVFLVEQV